MASTVKTIRADPAYAKLKALAETIRGAVDLDVLEKEAKRLHTARPSRNLYKSNMTPTLLWQALATDMSNRARLIEVNASVFKQSQLLEAATNHVRLYLSTQYKEDIDDEARTVAAKKQYLDNVMSLATKQIAEMKAFCELIQFYVKDIDQAGYALTNAVKLLSLTVERPNQVV